METLSNCPNCKAELKQSFFGSNILVAEETTQAIHLFTSNKADAHCSKCAEPLIAQAKEVRNNQLTPLMEEMEQMISLVPIITLQHPHGWDYTVVKMVTAQTVTGTGVISEISSSISDLFGGQSNRLSNKLKDGETMCMDKLRFEAVNCGANAIIGTDIDYAEVGGDKGMLMVCMSGTAVKINNLDVLGQSASLLQNLNNVIEGVNTYKQFAHLFTESSYTTL